MYFLDCYDLLQKGNCKTRLKEQRELSYVNHNMLAETSIYLLTYFRRKKDTPFTQHILTVN